MSIKIEQYLESYKQQFEKALHQSTLQFGDRTALRDACEYALSTGKRIRPIIVLMIADALHLDFDVMASAIAVECFHAASLIADDLPCMDDETTRRGLPAVHLAFGESTALLASYSLIATGYELISKNSQIFRKKNNSKSDQLCEIAVETASRCGGILGATNGQFLDLSKQDHSLDTILKIIEQKTGTLFEVSFILGWIFGGGALHLLSDVKKSAHHLGKAFQIADDLLDIQQDQNRQSKINIAAHLGIEKTKELFHFEIKELKKKLSKIELLTKPFTQLIQSLELSIVAQ